MDDVALIHNDHNELQKMLDTTDEIAKRYHIKFGKEKSQIITIGKSTINHNFHLGDQILDQTTNYKYLGMSINDKGNLEDHLNKLKGKVEAALQTIFTLAGNDEFQQIEMSTIWRLVHSCIIPILMYGAETWTPTRKEISQAQKILDNVIKRILKTPTTTPTEILTAETRIWEVEIQMMQKQIMYYHRIITKIDEEKQPQLIKLLTNKKKPWNKQIKETLEKTDINETELLSKNPKQAKRMVRNRLENYQTHKIYKAAENKSKVRDYICYQRRYDTKNKPNYINNLSRNDCSNIFTTRARMIHVKGNYKNKHTDMKCRWCTTEPETQKHIITKCPAFKEITNGLTYDDLYANDITTITKTKQTMRKVILKLKEKQT